MTLRDMDDALTTFVLPVGGGDDVTVNGYYPVTPQTRVRLTPDGPLYGVRQQLLEVEEDGRVILEVELYVAMPD